MKRWVSDCLADCPARYAAFWACSQSVHEQDGFVIHAVILAATFFLLFSTTSKETRVNRALYSNLVGDDLPFAQSDASAFDMRPVFSV